jgi:ssDNA-specific exonuclease RecJ
MEAIVAKLQARVMETDELEMMLCSVAAQLPNTTQIEDRLLEHADVLLDSPSFCEELSRRFVAECADRAAAVFADQEEVKFTTMRQTTYCATSWRQSSF